MYEPGSWFSVSTVIMQSMMRCSDIHCYSISSFSFWRATWWRCTRSPFNKYILTNACLNVICFSLLAYMGLYDTNFSTYLRNIGTVIVIMIMMLIMNLNLNLKKCLLDKKQIQAGNNVIDDTYRVFYVGRPLQRRWAHRWRKSHPNILQCMNRHRAHEVLTYWEHEFGICNQNESTPLGKAPSRHTQGPQLT